MAHILEPKANTDAMPITIKKQARASRDPPAAHETKSLFGEPDENHFVCAPHGSQTPVAIKTKMAWLIWVAHGFRGHGFQ